MSKLPIHRAMKPKTKDKLTRGLKQLPEVEFIRPWQGYVVGARIQPPGVLRQVLMQQKYAKLVEAKPKAPVQNTAPKLAVKKETPKPEVKKETLKPAVKKSAE